MSKTKVDKIKDQELGKSIGNGIRLVPQSDSNQIYLPKQTVAAISFYDSLQKQPPVTSDYPGFYYQIPKKSNEGYLISSEARPPKIVFGHFASVNDIEVGGIESRMFRNVHWSIVGTCITYVHLLRLTRNAIKLSLEYLDSIEISLEVKIPAFLNVQAIDNLHTSLENTITTVETENLIESDQIQNWKDSKKSIRRFLAETRVKVTENLTNKATRISKNVPEIFKQLKWIIGGIDNKPISKTGQMLLAYGQDVLMPYFEGEEVFDNQTLNTNFFSIGQVWEYDDMEGNRIYTPLTLNNLDTGYLPYSLEIRFLFDALKNVGPRLINIQSTYDLLSSSIFDYIHKQAKTKQGEDYSKVVIDNQIRITFNSLLAGFYNDICNDFKEVGASNITIEAQAEIKEWILGLLEV